MAIAAQPPRLDVPVGNLQGAIVAIGSQANVDIGLTDTSLGSIPLLGIHGSMSVATALKRLLAGTAVTFRQIDAVTFQIVRLPLPASRPAGVVPQLEPSHAPASIVVTGSKQSIAIATYAGSVQIADLAAVRPIQMMRGSDALVQQIPILASTHLGAGRNKLFIRGIADSSFNGPSQATVGQYLGDVRLNFNAPDPDLALYDISAVEVLEGPQGTLYGAGSLGGVIRLAPTPPDLANMSLALSGGGSTTTGGSPGGDGAVIANLPLAQGRLGLRAVAYASVDGGYIDDPLRGLSDINRVSTRGGRATLRYAPSATWTIDIGGVVQNINDSDGQYSLRGLPPLQRESVIAQPFDNDYWLADIVARHVAGATTFVSATSIVSHDVGSTFDASPSPAVPMRYSEKDDISLITNETRVSHHAVTGGGWVIGVELLRNVDRLRRVLGPVGAEGTISGTRNATEQASLYGEATLLFAPRLFATGGARLGYTHAVGEILDEPDGDVDVDVGRRNFRVLPSIGLLWKADARLSAYARYQEGFRPGGLSVEASGTQRFESDSVTTWEAGLRYASPHLTGSAALSYARWTDIQADLVDSAGLPFTANIGSGRIAGLEAQFSWRPRTGIAVDGSLFINHSRLDRPAAAFAGERDARLPNIPRVTAKLGARYDFVLLSHMVELSGSLQYVGRSRLGVGPTLDLGQGGYVDTAIGATLPVGRVTFSLDLTNLLDKRGNIFALGNPFGVQAGRQITTLRPRTVRLGAAVAF